MSQVHGLELSTVLESVGVVVDQLGALEDHGDVGLVARRHGGEHEIGLHAMGEHSTQRVSTLRIDQGRSKITYLALLSIDADLLCAATARESELSNGAY